MVELRIQRTAHHPIWDEVEQRIASQSSEAYNHYVYCIYDQLRKQLLNQLLNQVLNQVLNQPWELIPGLGDYR